MRLWVVSFYAFGPPGQSLGRPELALWGSGVPGRGREGPGPPGGREGPGPPGGSELGAWGLGGSLGLRGFWVEGLGRGSSVVVATGAAVATVVVRVAGVSRISQSPRDLVLALSSSSHAKPAAPKRKKNKARGRCAPDPGHETSALKSQTLNLAVIVVMILYCVVASVFVVFDLNHTYIYIYIYIFIRKKKR